MKPTAISDIQDHDGWVHKSELEFVQFLSATQYALIIGIMKWCEENEIDNIDDWEAKL